MKKMIKIKQVFMGFVLFSICFLSINSANSQECKSDIKYMDLGGRIINQACYLPESKNIVIVCEEGGDIYYLNIEDQRISNKLTLGEKILFASFSSDNSMLLVATVSSVVGIDTKNAKISYKYKNPGLYSYYAPQKITGNILYFYSTDKNDYLVINVLDGSSKNIKLPVNGKLALRCFIWVICNPVFLLSGISL